MCDEVRPCQWNKVPRLSVWSSSLYSSSPHGTVLGSAPHTSSAGVPSRTSASPSLPETHTKLLIFAAANWLILINWFHNLVESLKNVVEENVPKRCSSLAFHLLLINIFFAPPFKKFGESKIFEGSQTDRSHSKARFILYDFGRDLVVRDKCWES